ncbi:hypothetical protein [Acaryochloris sp. IP29b_bin.137]|uniref:hypothetical protein n=1 Tax=Acaryochloris sp. IP29b_bin.137 TaxID=2969217 RepID=UPI00263154BF|nr:hypothetical protein [Acaryochloris sp. IP29b_bin.137]
MLPSEVGTLCGGSGSWVFESLAEHLSLVLSVEVVQYPAQFNYLLAYDQLDEIIENAWFIPFEGIHIASDKRLVAKSFHTANVWSPKTLLC